MSSIITVPIQHCRHYTAFAYGNNSINPYENYICSMHQGMPPATRRRNFYEFLQYYRPKNVSEALGVATQRKYPLWSYPWNSALKAQNVVWTEDPNAIPDIITHFSEKGILEFRILQEFFWLENAYYTIKNYGYLPEKYGYCTAWKLKIHDNSVRYLITDGNHRISALSALGIQEVAVTITSTIEIAECKEWIGIKNGHFTIDDAVSVFRAYFPVRTTWKTTDEPATIIYL